MNIRDRKIAGKEPTAMITQEMIDRINQLYHKSQSEGLTTQEKEEQATLRKAYIESIRTNMRANLDRISIREADGSITDLGKKHGKKETS